MSLTLLKQDDSQDASVDQLKQLPADVLRTIVRLLSIDSEDQHANAALSALRLCSQSLAAATDSARLTITLHPSHIENAIPYLAKLSSLAGVVLRASTSTEHLIHTIPTLQPLSRVLPNLTSLTFHSGSDVGYLELQGVEQMLLPWRHSLTHLKMYKCCMSEVVEDAEDSINLIAWSLDFPSLTSLVLTHSMDMSSEYSELSEEYEYMALNLSGCPQLRELDLRENMDLSQLQLPGSGHLCMMTCVGSNELAVLDLSGCCKLKHLECGTNTMLSSLVLDGCTALQSMTLEGNDVLVSVGLSHCVALERLVCKYNDALGSLDLTPCSSMTSVDCTSNKSLVGLTLPHRGGKLDTLECTHNNSLASLDVSGCGALRMLECYANPVMASLKVAGCCTLEEVVCTSNPALLCLDFSRCEALRCLILSRNCSLVKLNLLGCWELQILDQSGCDQLGDAHVYLFLACTGYEWLESVPGRFVFAK